MFQTILTSIDHNTLQCYASGPSNSNTKSKAEDLKWSVKYPQPLFYLTIQKICQIWNEAPQIKLVFPRDKIIFLNVLNPKSNFESLVKHIESDIFWKKAYIETFGELIIKEKCRRWKNMYLEKYYSTYLMNLHPKKYDPVQIQYMVDLCGPFIEHLNVTSFIPNDIETPYNASKEIMNIMNVIVKDNKTMFKESSDSIRDHISLHAALSNMNNLVKLHLTFQQSDVGTSFHNDQFQLTITDAKNLSKGLENCESLKNLSITRSDLDCKRVKYILKGLINHIKLESIEFSHCKIRNEGALTISKFIVRKENVKTLILTDNLIGVEGAEGIGYALNQNGCKLTALNLRLNNKLGSEGVAYIAIAIARGCNLTSLNISGCSITPKPLSKSLSVVWSISSIDIPPPCGLILARAISLGRTPLRSLDVSVNEIGKDSDKAISNAICLSSLIEINLKQSGLGSLAMAVGESAVAANRLRRDAERGFRFKRSASRVLQANRIVRVMNMGGDPIVLAQKLSARPSIVSVTSDEGTFTVTPQPLPTEFGFIPAFKNPLSSSRASSITGPPTSRRSSHQILDNFKEAKRSALVRRRSDGSLINSKGVDIGRRITIFVSNEPQESDNDDK